MSKRYTLYIDAFTPETIPMARLAQYMQNFATILGHEGAVHFQGLKHGSTQLVTRIDHEDVPKVAEHLTLIKNGDASPGALRAQDDLDRMLAEDNATGYVYEDDDQSAEIIAFPGKSRPKPSIFGPINQDGTLDGILVSIGGKDKTVHLQLQNGDINYTGIETTRDVARRLGKHLYEPVRIRGTGRWLRDAEGQWILKRFRVTAFDVLKEADLQEAIEQLRQIPGSDWNDIDNPIAALRAMREKGGGFH